MKRQFLALSLLSTGLIWAGANEGIHGVGLGLGKKPCKPCGDSLVATTDANGTFTFNIPEAGTYQIFILNALPNISPGTGVSLTTATYDLSGPTQLPSTRLKPAMANVVNSARSSKKNNLAIPDPSGNVHFTDTYVFTGPAIMYGQLQLSQPLTPVDTLTFTAYTGGPLPLSQDIQITKPIDMPSLPTYSLPSTCACIQVTQPQTGVLTLSAASTDLQPGLYYDVIQITSAPTDGSTPITQNVSITTNIKAPSDNLGIQLSPAEFPLPPLPTLPFSTDQPIFFNDRFTTVNIAVTNLSSATETYQLMAQNFPDQATFTFTTPTFSVASGQTLQVPITIDQDALAATTQTRTCALFVRTDGATATSCAIRGPYQDATSDLAPFYASQTCQPSQLLPVIATAPATMQEGVAATFQIQAIDNCGTPATNFVAEIGSESTLTGSLAIVPPTGASANPQLTVHVTAGTLQGATTLTPQIEASVVPATNGRAVSTKGISGSLAVPNNSGVVLNGTNLANTTLAASPDPTVPLPTQLAGTSLWVDGVQLPLLGISPTSIAALVPLTLTPGDHLSWVTTPTGTSSPQAFSISTAAPEIFTGPDGLTAIGYKLLPDGTTTPLGPNNPATPGDTVVVYVNGLAIDESATSSIRTQRLAPRAVDYYLKLDGVMTGGQKATVVAADARVNNELENVLGDYAGTPVDGRPMDILETVTFIVPPGAQSANPATGLVDLQITSAGIDSNIVSLNAQSTQSTNVTYNTFAAPNGPVTYSLDTTTSLTGLVPQTDSPGAIHTLSVSSPQTSGASQFTLNSWLAIDPTGTNTAPTSGTSFTITLPNVTSATPLYFGAIFDQSDPLTLTVFPPACGAITATPGDLGGGFYPDGLIALTLALNPGWTFVAWSGADARGQLTLNGPTSATAICKQIPSTVNLSFTTAPLPLSISVNGNTIVGNSGLLPFTPGQSIPLDVPLNPQTPGDPNTRYTFYGWSQGGPTTQTLVVPNSSTAFAAYFLTQQNLTIVGTASANPSSPDGFYSESPAGIGQSVTITGTCPSGQLVSGYTVQITGTGGASFISGPTATVVMNAPATVTVQCVPQPSTCVPPPSGMISWYSLDEPQSPSLDIAPAGGAANAAWIGNPTPVPGMVAGALSFDGATQWLQAANASEADIALGDMSADAWIKTTSTAPQEIVTKYVNGNVDSAAGYQLDLFNGQLIFTAKGAGHTYGEGWGTTPPVSLADGNWHHVAVTISRSSPTGGVLYVDGAAASTFNPTSILTSGSWSNSQPLSIGGPDPTALFNGAIDEVEIFNRALASNEVGQIYLAGSLGKCKTAAIIIDTLPPNLNVMWSYGIGNSTPVAGAPAPQIVPNPTYPVAISAPSPQTNNGAYYTFASWSDSQPQSHNVNTVGDYIATFNLSGYVVNATGCGVSVGPISQAIQSNPFIFPPNTLLTIAANPTSGQSLTSIVVTGASGTQTFTTSPVTITLTGPLTITANCTASSNVTLTVATNPTGLQARIGTTGPYTAAPISLQVPPNQTQAISVTSPQFLSATGTGYSFTGWSTGGSTATTTVQPSSNFTATANFNVACYALTVNVSPTTSGIVALNPPSGGLIGVPANCYAPGTSVALTATPSTGNVFQSWTGATGTTSTTTVTVNAPTTVTANFGSPSTVTLTAAVIPANAGLIVNINGLVGPTSTSVAPGSTVTLSALATQSLNGTQYCFSTWSPGAQTATSITFPAPTTATTYTANYSVCGYAVAVTTQPAGCASYTLNPSVPSTGYYTPGASVTINATANSGYTLNSIGGSITGTNQPAATFSMSQPQNITIFCNTAQTFPATVTSSPVGLKITVDGTQCTTPCTFTWIAASSHTLAAATYSPSTGTQEVFVAWANGGAASKTVLAPTQVTTTPVDTANFQTQYLLTLAVNQSSEGTVSAAPTSTTSYYNAGTQVTVTGTPATDFTLYSFLDTVDSTNLATNPRVFTMTAPRTVTAEFEALPVFITFGSSQRGTTSGTAYHVIGNLATNGASFNNVQITSVVWTTVSGTGTITDTTTLPISAGNLVNGTLSPQITLTADMPATVASFTVKTSGTAVSTISGNTYPWTDNQNGSFVFTK